MTEKNETIKARKAHRAALRIASLLTIMSTLANPMPIFGSHAHTPPGKTREEPKTKARRKMAAKSRKANRRH